MLFTYSKASKKISLYKETDMREHRILERQDIEKWVENCPSILGEELLIVTTEYDRFDKTDERLDLLAIDKDGFLVVIELKRDDSGKTVELQAIKYAAYCSTLTLKDIAGLYQQYLSRKKVTCTEDEAKKKILDFIENSDFEELNDKPRIILVSKVFRPEVTATVMWLRNVGVDITCVKITPYAIDKDTIAFESNVLIPLPEAKDFIISTEKKENAEHNLTVSQEEYLKFYGELISMLEKQLPLTYVKPTPKSYYQIPTGRGSVHYEWAFHGRPRSSFGVELHFERGNREYNLKLINSLKRLKSTIEKKTGERVTFQSKWGENWARMYIEKAEGKMTPELKKWAVEKMAELYSVIQPVLERLK